MDGSGDQIMTEQPTQRVELAGRLRPMLEEQARERTGGRPAVDSEKPRQLFAEVTPDDRVVDAQVAKAAALKCKPQIEAEAEARMKSGKAADPVQNSAQGSKTREKLRPMLDKEAREKQAEAGKEKLPQLVAEADETPDDRTVDAKVAKAAGVSRETVRRRKIIAKEAPE